jgi:FtsH-binding integral membrane protein
MKIFTKEFIKRILNAVRWGIIATGVGFLATKIFFPEDANTTSTRSLIYIVIGLSIVFFFNNRKKNKKTEGV